MGRSRAGWIAAVAGLALLAAFVATCEPAAEVPGPEVTPDGDSAKPAGGRAPRPRARRDGGLPEGADAPTEGPADATTGTETGSDGAPRPIERAPGPQVTVRRIVGRVVDSSNDKFVGGARVLLAVFSEHSAVPWGAWGDVTGSDGCFDVGPREDELHDGSRVEVIVVSPAHHLARAPAEPDVIVRLEPRRTPELHGAIAGTVTDASGAPVAGVRQLSTQDATGEWRGLWTLAAADGSFRVDGVAPGPWSVGAGEGQPRVECLVAPGGEARVTLVVARDERPHAKLTDEELQSRLTTAIGHVKGFGPASGTEEGRAELLQLQLELQSLRWEELLRRPVRAVVVEGLPADATVVRARRPGTSQWWSARPASGRAAFPALYATEWDLEVERPGSPVAVQRVSVSVPAGEEPLVVRWAAAE